MDQRSESRDRIRRVISEALDLWKKVRATQIYGVGEIILIPEGLTGKDFTLTALVARTHKASTMAKQYWLMKSEAECFSIDDLFAAKDQTTFWDGIRNYQVRNMLRDEVKVGDLVLFYHSNGKPPGVAGVAEVVKAGYPDHTAFEKGHEHFDSKSDPDNPTWYMVDLKAVEKFTHFVGLPELRELPELAEMDLFRRNRLSVTAVKRMEFDVIRKLGRRK